MIEAQFKIMEKRFDEMEERFDEFEENFKKFSEMLNTIYIKLTGNPLNPMGIVKEIEDLKIEIRTLKKFRDRATWTLSIVLGIGIALGGILTLLFELLQIKR